MTTVCKNCAAEYTGKYCPECGQKAKTGRITTKTVLQEIRKNLVHYDRGFLHTAIQLLRRPGHTVRDYLDGKRVEYTKPVQYMLWATAINFLLFQLLGQDKEMLQALSEQPGQNAAGVKITQYIFDHPAIITFLMIPNIALFSWLYFRKAGFNYAEHFVLNAYLMGEVSMLGILTSPLSKFVFAGPSMMHVNLGISMALWFGYVGWGYAQFFRSRRPWWAWLKGVLTILSGYVMLMIIVAIVTATALVLFGDQLKPMLMGN